MSTIDDKTKEIKKLDREEMLSLFEHIDRLPRGWNEYFIDEDFRIDIAAAQSKVYSAIQYSNGARLILDNDNGLSNLIKMHVTDSKWLPGEKYIASHFYPKEVEINMGNSAPACEDEICIRKQTGRLFWKKESTTIISFNYIKKA